MKVSELIETARGHLGRGWTKGSYHAGRNVCAIGALERATMEHLHEGGVQAFEPAKKIVHKKLCEVLAIPVDTWREIPTMNDANDTTREDVEMAFEKAQIEAEEKEGLEVYN